MARKSRVKFAGALCHVISASLHLDPNALNGHSETISRKSHENPLQLSLFCGLVGRRGFSSSARLFIENLVQQNPGCCRDRRLGFPSGLFD